MNNNSNQELPHWYFSTLFEIPVKPRNYPSQFAIITAYNPLNRQLSLKENIANNKILEKELRDKYKWIYQINGFDKDTDHKENGFMFDVESFDQACDLGEKYSQDAIYFVKDDMLFVSKCNKKNRQLTKVGQFLAFIS